MGSWFGVQSSKTTYTETNSSDDSDPEADTGVRRVIRIFYNNTEQPIVLYQGTPLGEIMNQLKQILRLPQSCQLLFSDSEGIPVIMSSSIPHGTDVFMEVRYADVRSNKSNDQKQDRENEHKQNNFNWPFRITTKCGITQTGIFYLHLSKGNKSQKFYSKGVCIDGNKHEAFLSLYNHFGCVFSDELGLLDRNPRSALMPQPQATKHNKDKYTFDVIVDLRGKKSRRSKKKKDNGDREDGMYICLLPDNTCLSFSPFFDRQRPSEQNPLLLAIWTKNAIRAEIEEFEENVSPSLVPCSALFTAKAKYEHFAYQFE
ncbi:hypothetical protein RFI_02075 [Reticulomyxa filosa]|uniref:Uncharacterized protein n=1 Tax=Reticulomyxa filosa TaxID=46433 RepID=X6P900_RETFI|nr:hypothetical protein RFI_02075 [Reticulomyxa filosa]|eukprot:ETO35000.1 hypothetical protein RFI_02075 [Reticulomyxa filosa]